MPAIWITNAEVRVEPRDIADDDGTIDGESDFYPFGGERVVNVTSSGQHFKVTGKERDAESGLDNFGARYYASNMGRWMSPDWADKPEAVPYSSLDNPQSLNLYGYVRNNPLSQRDPDGHCCESDFDSLSDHPGKFQGGSDPMDRSFVSTMGDFITGALLTSVPGGAAGEIGELMANAKTGGGCAENCGCDDFSYRCGCCRYDDARWNSNSYGDKRGYRGGFYRDESRRGTRGDCDPLYVDRF